jgi:hypothetical protein
MLGGLLIVMLAGWMQYTPFHGDPKYLLEGNWQSCRDETGQFQERVYDQPQLGIEVHLGPADEFAVFRGVQEDHRDHATRENLLFPSYRVRAGHQRWEFDEAILDVARAGGSRGNCRSYWITLEPRKHTR